MLADRIAADALSDGIRALDAGDYPGARRFLETANRQDESAVTHYWLGRASLESGIAQSSEAATLAGLGEALGHFGRALDLGPSALYGTYLYYYTGRVYYERSVRLSAPSDQRTARRNAIDRLDQAATRLRAELASGEQAPRNAEALAESLELLLACGYYKLLCLGDDQDYQGALALADEFQPAELDERSAQLAAHLRPNPCYYLGAGAAWFVEHGGLVGAPAGQKAMSAEERVKWLEWAKGWLQRARDGGVSKHLEPGLQSCMGRVSLLQADGASGGARRIEAYEAACAAFRQVLAIGPTKPVAEETTAYLYMALLEDADWLASVGRRDDALLRCEEAKSTASRYDHRAALYGKAGVLYEQGKRARASGLFDQALTELQEAETPGPSWPASADAVLSRVRIAYIAQTLLGQPQPLTDARDQSLTLRVRDARSEVLTTYGAGLVESDPANAEKLLDEAIQLAPDKPMPKYRLAVIRRQQWESASDVKDVKRKEDLRQQGIKLFEQALEGHRLPERFDASASAERKTLVIRGIATIAVTVTPAEAVATVDGYAHKAPWPCTIPVCLNGQERRQVGVTASMEGYEPATVPVECQAGQEYVCPPIVLAKQAATPSPPTAPAEPVQVPASTITTAHFDIQVPTGWQRDPSVPEKNGIALLGPRKSGRVRCLHVAGPIALRGARALPDFSTAQIKKLGGSALAFERSGQPAQASLGGQLALGVDGKIKADSETTLAALAYFCIWQGSGYVVVLAPCSQSLLEGDASFQDLLKGFQFK